MKKLSVINISIIFLTLLFLFTRLAEDSKAAVSCPSSEIQCGSLDAQGGCEDNCLRVVTRGAAGGRGGIAWCQCQLPSQNAPGSVPEGGNCQKKEDCVASAPYCWAEPGQPATCHTTSPGTYPEDKQDPTCEEGTGINTAIGCIPIEQQGFVSFLLKWAIGIAGGIAFILIVIASFQIMTSQGDPKKLQAGKELLTSAIMGLILLIFSVFILRIIGVEILQIPGLS